MPFKVSFKHYDVISTVIRVTWGAHKSKFASLSPSKNFHAVYHLVMTTHRVITGNVTLCFLGGILAGPCGSVVVRER